jgi:hypothetical protein
MAKKTIASISDRAFDGLLEQFIERGEDKITLPAFLQVMSDVAAQRKPHEVELSGRLVNGEVIFDSPAALVAEKNTIYVGDTKVTLNLRVESK